MDTQSQIIGRGLKAGRVMTVEKAEELIEEALAHNFSVEGDSCPKARCLIWKENNTYPGNSYS